MSSYLMTALATPEQRSPDIESSAIRIGKVEDTIEVSFHSKEWEDRRGFSTRIFFSEQGLSFLRDSIDEFLKDPHRWEFVASDEIIRQNWCPLDHLQPQVGVKVWLTLKSEDEGVSNISVPAMRVSPVSEDGSRSAIEFSFLEGVWPDLNEWTPLAWKSFKPPEPFTE